MRLARLALASFLLSFCTAQLRADVVLAFDGSRCYTQYYLTGTNMVGPLAQLTAQGHTVVTTNLLTAAQLAGADIFVTGSMTPGSTLSAAEASALQAWVSAGGGLLYCGEGGSNAASNAQFLSLFNAGTYSGDYNAFSVVTTIVAPTHPVIAGPWGTVTDLSGMNIPGRFVSLTGTATAIANYPDGSTGYIAASYGSGRVVLVSDSVFFSYPPNYSASHAICWDNTIEWLRNGGPIISTVCPGDGTGVACPCGNTGSAGAGCLNSISTSALLSATGNPSVSGDTLVLNGSGMTNSTVLYFQGATLMTPTVFGDGLRCAGSPTVRFPLKLNVAGASQYPAFGDPSISGFGGCTAGDVRIYQAWYRDSANYCALKTFNLSNGVRVVWQP